MGAYDPMGLIAPALLPGNLLLRRLYGEGAPTWDEDLPPEEKASWVDWLEVLCSEAAITLERTVHPPGAEGSPILSAFADASSVAICVVFYAIWNTVQGPISRILLGKIRVAPVGGSSIPW